MFHHSGITAMDCQHFFRQIFLGYFPDIVQAFDTLGRNVYGDDYGLKFTEEALWRPPGAGGEVEKSRL